jgi:hypothetical protein
MSKNKKEAEVRPTKQVIVIRTDVMYNKQF